MELNGHSQVESIVLDFYPRGQVGEETMIAMKLVVRVYR